MPIRVILAAIIGGALMLGAGFIEHEQLHWLDRQMKTPVSVPALSDAIKANCPDSGVYMFPKPPENFMKMSKEEQQKAWEQMADKRALLVVPPKMPEFKMEEFLIKEGVSNVIACFLAAIVVAMTRPSIGFVGRWFVVVLIGLFSVASLTASYHIWYGFPLEYAQDELFCSALEVAMAGVAIAAIVVPRERMGY